MGEEKEYKEMQKHLHAYKIREDICGCDWI